MAGAVHRHGAVRQQIAGVYEQRAAIHATPPFLNADLPRCPLHGRAGERDADRRRTRVSIA
ncbi:hypothetical protein GCM10009678_57210 [Actinomadura kijaniata]